jgi:hypothetical protein
MLHMAFGIKNKALQYLVLQLLEQVADVAPYQYSVKGGGTPAAIKHVVKAMSNRPRLGRSTSSTGIRASMGRN